MKEEVATLDQEAKRNIPSSNFKNNEATLHENKEEPLGALGMPDSKMNFVLQKLQKLAIGPKDREEKKSKASKDELSREVAESQSIQDLEQ